MFATSEGLAMLCRIATVIRGKILFSCMKELLTLAGAALFYPLQKKQSYMDSEPELIDDLEEENAKAKKRRLTERRGRGYKEDPAGGHVISHRLGSFPMECG